MAVITPGKIPTVSDLSSKDDREKKVQQILARPRNFDDFITAYLHFSRNQESTEKIHRWTAISILAGAMERKCWLDLGHFQIYPNMYIFIVGDSGSVRKSTSTGIGIGLLSSLDNINFMSERITDRSLIDQLVVSGREFSVNEKRHKQSAVYVYASELIVFMKEVSGEISKLLTTFWDSPPRWLYQTKEEQLKVSGPCLNMLGASTPVWLQKALPMEELEGGLASRIIFVVENSPPERFFPWGAPRSAENTAIKQALIEDLEQISYLSGEFTYTTEAKEFYDKWYVECRKFAGKLTDVRLKGYYSRKPVSVWKLAMIFAVSESSTLVFDKRHLEKAIDYLADVEANMLDAFKHNGANKLSAGLERALGMIKERGAGGVSHREFMRTFYSEYSGRELDQIIADLMKMEGIMMQRRDREPFYVLARQ